MEVGSSVDGRDMLITEGQEQALIQQMQAIAAET
jgi:hypothetical protein